MSRIITMSLPASTLYVSGTVNDVAVTWTHTEGNTWEAEVDRSENDVYRVSLTIIDGNGNSSTATTILYYGLTGLITDRTANDVYRWRTLRDKGWQNMTEEEKSEWLSSLKGAYNYTDMNRVEGAVSHVAKELRKAGYNFNPVVKTDWKMTDEPTKEDMERYLGNVAAIREIFAVMPTTPQAPVVREKLTHDGANRLEQILLDVGALAEKLNRSWHYSGDLFTGEV